MLYFRLPNTIGRVPSPGVLFNSLLAANRETRPEVRFLTPFLGTKIAVFKQEILSALCIHCNEIEHCGN